MLSADRAGEEEVVLGHNAPSCARRPVDGDICQAVAVDADRSRSNIVETADQIDNGRLSSAGRADECDRLTGSRCKADILFKTSVSGSSE